MAFSRILCTLVVLKQTDNRSGHLSVRDSMAANVHRHTSSLLACSKKDVVLLKAILARQSLQFNVAFCWSDSDKYESVSPFPRGRYSVNTDGRSVNP